MKDSQEALVASVIEQLQNGVAPWVRPWATSGVSDMPHNMASGRRYSGCNVLALWMAQNFAGYPTAEWATFKQISSMGTEDAPVSVRKGEHGTAVWFMSPVIFKGKKNAATGKKDDDSKGFVLKQFTVFNRAQVDGLAPRQISEAKPFDAIAAAEEYISAIGADIRIGGDSAYFAPGPDYIAMPAPTAFDSPAHFYATELHELTHWTGGETRLDRKLNTNSGTKDYAFEELVAELGAAFNCAALGIAGNLRHVEYLGHWAAKLTEDPKALWRAASLAAKAVAFLDARAGVTADADQQQISATEGEAVAA